MKRETINATPSWSAVLPMLLAAYSDGSMEGIDIAQQELERMAALADKWVVQQERQRERERQRYRTRTWHPPSVVRLIDFVNSQPIGTVLEIATSQYATNNDAVFDWHTTAPAVRSVIARGLLEGKSCFRFYRVTVVAHSKEKLLIHPEDLL